MTQLRKNGRVLPTSYKLGKHLNPVKFLPVSKIKPKIMGPPLSTAARCADEEILCAYNLKDEISVDLVRSSIGREQRSPLRMASMHAIKGPSFLDAGRSRRRYPGGTEKRSIFVINSDQGFCRPPQPGPDDSSGRNTQRGGL
jgi:hypothetical protein